MSIRMILAPVRGDGRGEWILGLAAALARRFGAHIDVVHVHARPEDMLPFGVPIPGLLRDSIIDAVAKTAGEEETHLRDLFHDFCRSRGLREVEAAAVSAGPGVTVSWREEAGKQAAVIARLAPLADLLVVARPGAGGRLGHDTLESALFDVRKLTALAPPHEVAEAGRHVALAWNGSVEAARAVSLALPVLARAEAVTVLAAERTKLRSLDLDALRRYLSYHEVVAEYRDLHALSHEVAGPLLEAVTGVGADLLLMGAYGDSRRRELVLGGVTQYVVQHAELPVLMAH